MADVDRDAEVLRAARELAPPQHLRDRIDDHARFRLDREPHPGVRRTGDEGADPLGEALERGVLADALGESAAPRRHAIRSEDRGDVDRALDQGGARRRIVRGEGRRERHERVEKIGGSGLDRDAETAAREIRSERLGAFAPVVGERIEVSGAEGQAERPVPRVLHDVESRLERVLAESVRSVSGNPPRRGVRAHVTSPCFLRAPITRPAPSITARKTAPPGGSVRCREGRLERHHPANAATRRIAGIVGARIARGAQTRCRQH